MVLVKGYFDASMDSPNGVTSVAGHVGTEEAWATVEAKWKENLAYWNLKRFHLIDVLASMGQERGMLCALSFSAVVMKPCGLRLFSASVNDIDWDAMDWHPPFNLLFPKRQHFCLFQLFDALQYLRASINLNPDDQIQLVFDADYESEASALQVYEVWKGMRKHPGFDSVTIARRLTGLEVADLAAGIQRRLGVPGMNHGLNYGDWLQHAKNVQADKAEGTLWSRELVELQKRVKAEAEAKKKD